jgi:hypothetical protein
MSGRTTEVLVLTAATALPAEPLFFRRAVQVQNLGPNPIFVAYSSDAAVASKAFKLATGETLPVAGESFSLYGVTTVNQVTGAATIVMELEQ